MTVFHHCSSPFSERETIAALSPYNKPQISLRCFVVSQLYVVLSKGPTLEFPKSRCKAAPSHAKPDLGPRLDSLVPFFEQRRLLSHAQQTPMMLTPELVLLLHIVPAGAVKEQRNPVPGSMQKSDDLHAFLAFDASNNYTWRLLRRLRTCIKGIVEAIKDSTS